MRGSINTGLTEYSPYIHGRDTVYKLAVDRSSGASTGLSCIQLQANGLQVRVQHCGLCTRVCAELLDAERKDDNDEETDLASHLTKMTAVYLILSSPQQQQQQQVGRTRDMTAG